MLNNCIIISSDHITAIVAKTLLHLYLVCLK